MGAEYFAYLSAGAESVSTLSVAFGMPRFLSADSVVFVAFSLHIASLNNCCSQLYCWEHISAAVVFKLSLMVTLWV